MGWFRKKRKEIAQEFVNDVTKEIGEKTKKKSKDWLEVALLAVPAVIGIANLVTGTEKVNVPVDSSKAIFIHNSGTVNIYKV